MNLNLPEKFKTHYWYWIKLAALAAAVVLLTWQSWHEITSWLVVFAFIVIGYGFGKLTCMRTVQNYGLSITLLVFVFLNLLHSTIDGIALIGHARSEYFPILAHEIVRQSALYVIIAESIAPFLKSVWARIPVAIISVSGVWVLGIIIGLASGNAIRSITWLDPYLPMTMFILVGDMIHHMVDEYQGFRNRS
jgi:hypothetical protein